MAKRSRPPGIFCVEGDWWNDFKHPSTVRPVLDLLLQSELRVPFIHRNVDTADAFRYYLGKWSQAAHADYPILYLAFHGREGRILFGDFRRKDSEVTLEEMEDLLEGKCHRRILFFSGCDTLHVDKRHLARFLRRTKALAVCGYRDEVGWMESTAFELMVFAAMQENRFTASGVRAMRRRIGDTAGQLAKSLGFRMLIKGE